MRNQSGAVLVLFQWLMLLLPMARVNSFLGRAAFCRAPAFPTAGRIRPAASSPLYRPLLLSAPSTIPTLTTAEDGNDDDMSLDLDEASLLERISAGEALEEEDDNDGDDDDGEETVEDLSLWEIANLIQDQVPVGMLDADQVELLRHVLHNLAAATSAPAPPREADGVNEADENDDGATKIASADPVAVEKLLYRLVDEYQSKMSRLDREGDDDESEWVQSMLTDDDFLVAAKAWKASLLPDRPTFFDRSKARRDADSSRQALDGMDRVLSLYGTQLDLHRQQLSSDPNEDPSSLPLAPSPELVETVLAVVAAQARERRSVDREAGDVVRAYQDACPNELPSALMYRYWIEATAKSRGNNRDRRGGGGGSSSASSADRAESILKKAMRIHPPSRNDEGNVVGMTIDSFNVILTSWAKSGLEYGPDRAEKLLVWMEQVGGGEGEGGDALLRPTVSSFTSLVDAYAQTNDWDGIAKAENILNRMLEMHLDGNSDNGDMEPNIATWTIVISAWARLSKKHYKGASNRAHQLLKRMEQLHSEGRISFAPDAIVYVTCMNAFAFSKAPDGPGMAREILDEMYERYLDGDDTMKPSPKSIRVVIGSFVDLGTTESMELAEQTLDHYEDMLESIDATAEDPMEHLRDVYRTLLFGWCKVDNPAAAQSYLLDMVERGMKPDCFCWDRVIEANARKPEDPKSLKRTIRIWELMKEEEKKENLKPNERIYTSYIRALTKAKVNNLASQSLELLGEMKDGYRAGNQGLDPTVFTCNAVLLACSEDATAPDAAFRVAVQVFNDIRAMSDGPDQVSFGNMLRCAKLLPPGDRRDALVQSTFQLCCKRGFVNSFVIRDLQSVAEESVWRNLLQCPTGEARPELLPAPWTRKFAAAKQKIRR